jgi:CBS domain-containing protein
MKVQEVMVERPVTCRPTTDLASCARKMWDGDFGFLPVVGERGDVVGVVTDRDICMAAAMRDVRPGDILVRDAMTTPVHACSVEDDVDDAIACMRDHQLRRLPVTDVDGVVRGVVSLNDLVLGARDAGAPDVAAPTIPCEKVMEALRAIARHRAEAGTA